MKVLAVSDTVAETLCSDRIREHSTDVERVPACGDLPSDYLEYVVTMLNVPLSYVPGDYDRLKQLADGTLSEGPRGGRNIAGKVVRVEWEAGRGETPAIGVHGCGVPEIET
jgi:predicted phosphodiesterase